MVVPRVSSGYLNISLKLFSFPTGFEERACRWRKKNLNDEKEWIPVREFLQCKEEGENKRRKKSKVKILTEIGDCLAIYLSCTAK